MKSGIYKITCGSKYYYGQTQDFKVREKHHRGDLKRGVHKNPILQAAYNKHQDLTFEVVLVCETNELDRYEQWFLDQYVDMEKCANLARCAEANMRGYQHSDEFKQKMREQANALWADPEMRAKMCAGRKGRKDSDATRARKSKAQKGKKLPKDQRGKIAASVTEYWSDPQNKAKRSEIAKKANRKYTYLVTFTDGKQREYPNLGDIAKAIGATAAAVSAWARGVRPPSKKYGITALTRKAL